ncbi:MAG: 2-oxo acid dehydrogenase subunit E2 [Proteobacteria bacterium]|nr:2-oxo acid dehydrogenase subunit E2 [Pseudomonadota bacterium]
MAVGFFAGHVLPLSLSCDHRVVDGVLGAQFLAAFKKLIEYPPAMLL